MPIVLEIYPTQGKQKLVQKRVFQLVLPIMTNIILTINLKTAELSEAFDFYYLYRLATLVQYNVA